MSKINWFVKPAFDVPELKSPQPCKHGAGCDYMEKDPDTFRMVRACCRFVHPGEEGNGRRLFPAREGQPACVRLTGRASYYERRRWQISWADWCSKNGIAYTANKPGEEPPPLVIVRIGGPATGTTTARTLRTPQKQRIQPAEKREVPPAPRKDPTAAAATMNRFASGDESE